MRVFRYILLLVGVVLASTVCAQNVTNADFYQDGNKVVITYHLDVIADITVQFSTDGGLTFSTSLLNVSGDVGDDVQPGDKTIIWDALAEYEKLAGAKFQFRITATEDNGQHNGYEYVDLGLPSGTLWATCNVGANKPEEYGDYFAWGETNNKSAYVWFTYKYCVGDFSTLTKYCLNIDNETFDNKVFLDSSDDAACVNWGGKWRLPTPKEQKELIRKCTWIWTTLNGINGYRVKGPNGNHIFLPSAGYRFGEKVYFAEKKGYYWSSFIFENNESDANILHLTPEQTENSTYGRCYGLSIRPVLSPK